MRRSRVEAAESRKTVVHAAAALLRERGIEGVSIADVMGVAGMTPGGFYKHFEDKDALVEEAFDVGSDESIQTMRKIGEAAPSGRSFATVVAAYLSAEHRSGRARGCTLAAHVSDAARQGKGFRRAFTAGIYRMLDLLTGAAARDARSLRREDALATLASLVGALALARATDDETLGTEILRAVKNKVASIDAPRTK